MRDRSGRKGKGIHMVKVLTLRLQGPYDLPLSIKAAAAFSPEPVPNFSALRMAIRIDGTPVLMEMRQVKKRPPLLEVFGPSFPLAGPLKTAAEWILLTDMDLRPFYRLTAEHPKLAAIARGLYGLKPVRPASLFEMAVIAITEQQISLSAAYRIRSRVVERFGENREGLWAFPSEERLAHASLNEFMACGLSRRKSEYISNLARDIADGLLDLASLKDMSDEDARSLLIRQRGFGRWSADYILVRGLGRPDSVPVDDLGVRTIAGKYLGDGRRMSPQELEKALKPFAPYRGLAAFYLMAHFRLYFPGRRRIAKGMSFPAENFDPAKESPQAQPIHQHKKEGRTNHAKSNPF